MSLAQFFEQEINVYSYLYYRLVKEINNLLESNKRAALKQELIEEIVSYLQRRSSKICQKAYEKLNKIEEIYRNSGFDIVSFEAKLEERGLFGASQHFSILLFEVGLEFDPYLNTPIIPGSSLKGAIRSSWRSLFSNKFVDAENTIFGSKDKIGACIFHDGYPIKPGKNNCLLYPDVITPHYIKEGQDILKETETELRPKVYLTVAPETVFKFIIAIPEDLNKELKKMLIKAILETLKIGIGGKTSIGYGRFSLINMNIGVFK